MTQSENQTTADRGAGIEILRAGPVTGDGVVEQGCRPDKTHEEPGAVHLVCKPPNP